LRPIRLFAWWERRRNLPDWPRISKPNSLPVAFRRCARRISAI